MLFYFFDCRCILLVIFVTLVPNDNLGRALYKSTFNLAPLSKLFLAIKSVPSHKGTF